jgi:uncharacterized membrane protein YeiH
MFEIAEFIGIVAFTTSGFLAGSRNRLDLLGVLTATFLTALGGGIARDIAVGKIPYTFNHTLPALIVLVVMILLVVFQFHKKNSIENKPLFIVTDSIGLISFSISGGLVAIDSNLNLAGVLVLSFLTAAGGGIARDVILNEVPFVFKTGFYGTIALIIALALFVLDKYFTISYISLVLVFVLAFCLRLVAYYKKWSVPLP